MLCGYVNVDASSRKNEDTDADTVFCDNTDADEDAPDPDIRCISKQDFMYFILENRCSQQYVLPDMTTMCSI